MSTTRDEVLSTLKTNLKAAGDYNKLSLSSGYTQSAPAGTERVLKQAALNVHCAEKYFDDEEKQGLSMLAATIAELIIGFRVKKTRTITSEMLRALVTRDANAPRKELGTCESDGTADAITF